MPLVGAASDSSASLSSSFLMTTSGSDLPESRGGFVICRGRRTMILSLLPRFSPAEQQQSKISVCNTLCQHGRLIHCTTTDALCCFPATSKVGSADSRRSYRVFPRRHGCPRSLAAYRYRMDRASPPARYPSPNPPIPSVFPSELRGQRRK